MVQAERTAALVDGPCVPWDGQARAAAEGRASRRAELGAAGAEVGAGQAPRRGCGENAGELLIRTVLLQYSGVLRCILPGRQDGEVAGAPSRTGSAGRKRGRSSPPAPVQWPCTRRFDGFRGICAHPSCAGRAPCTYRARYRRPAEGAGTRPLIQYPTPPSVPVRGCAAWCKGARERRRERSLLFGAVTFADSMSCVGFVSGLQSGEAAAHRRMLRLPANALGRSAQRHARRRARRQRQRQSPRCVPPHALWGSRACGTAPSRASSSV